MTAQQPAKGKGKNFSAAVSMNDKQSMCSDEIEKKLDPEMAGESVVDEDSSEFKQATNEDSKSNTFLGQMTNIFGLGIDRLMSKPQEEMEGSDAEGMHATENSPLRDSNTEIDAAKIGEGLMAIDPENME